MKDNNELHSQQRHRDLMKDDLQVLWSADDIFTTLDLTKEEQFY